MTDPPPSGASSPVFRSALAFVILALLVAVLLFATAGTVVWPMAWAYVVLSTVGTVVSRVLVARKHPDTLAERARGWQGKGVQTWDRWLMPVVMLSTLAILAVAGLDHRFSWSRTGPLAVQVGALAVSAVGYALVAWAMAENRFFSSAVRIQSDRGHVVVSTGPYGLVRHPGYAGSVLATLCMPLILDSAWAFVPTALTLVALVVRTALEDRLLREELNGYQAFAERMRWRLLPGVW